MSSRDTTSARFGPFHRRSETKPDENELIVSSGQLWGRPRRNFFAGLFPAVKAWEGPLPEDVVGVEFFTNVPPDPWSVPGWPEWTEGSPEVIVLERGELVAIEIVVTKRRDAG
jgi:hypothetical protein